MKSQKAKPDKPKTTNHEPTLLLVVPRKETLSEYETRLIAFAVGICWGMIVARIMRVIYDKDKEKSKEENAETKVDRE